MKGSDTVADDYLGDSVAISGTTAIVGADGHTKSAGRVYVFTKHGRRVEAGCRVEGLRHRRE